MIVVDDFAAHFEEEALFDLDMQLLFIRKGRVPFKGVGEYFTLVFDEGYLTIWRFYSPFLCLYTIIMFGFTFSG